MIDKQVLEKLVKALYQVHQKKKGGAVLKPETQTNLKQVKMIEPPVSVGGECTGGATETKTKKSNSWLDHVKKVKSENPTMKYKDVLKKAKETYTKKTGGAVVTKTYPAQKTAKTSDDYETKVEDPVKTQDKLWKEYKQNKGTKKTNLKTVTQQSSKGRKPKVTIVKPESDTKPLKIRKPRESRQGVHSAVKLQINMKKPTKTFAKEIGEEFKKIRGQTPEEILREARAYVPEREGQRVRSAVYGEEEKVPLFGKGMVTFEKQLFKHIEKETKDMSPSKAKTYARKYITEALKEKGWKPIEIKPILQMALERLDKVGGSIFPKSNVEHLLDGLQKSGVFSATTKALDSMATKLSDVVNDPHKYRYQSILTRDIPNLQLKYEKLKNVWDVKSDNWTDFRRNNHKIRMMNAKSEIVNRLNKLAGINMITVKQE